MSAPVVAWRAEERLVLVLADGTELSPRCACGRSHFSLLESGGVLVLRCHGCGRRLAFPGGTKKAT